MARRTGLCYNENSGKRGRQRNGTLSVCLFCDFLRDKVKIYGLEDIERQLGMLKVIEDDRNRMHFLGCNPFFLGTEILVFLCEMTKMYLPKVTEINMYARDHAVKTAEMLSRLHPDTIWCISLKLWENTPLYDMAQSGTFEPLTPREILEEEREMVSRLNLTRPCHYVDSTVLQKYTVSVMLPEGKESLLMTMDQLLSGELRPGE